MSFKHHDSPPITRKLIGQRVLRSEDKRLVTGRGKYLADLVFPGELHVAFVRSPLAHARITNIDTTEAQAAEGVHLVWTGADAAEYCVGMEAQFNADGCMPMTMPLMAREVVRYGGEPIALVVADTRALAEDACDLISIDFEDLDVVLDPRKSILGGPTANGERPDNVALRGRGSYGNAGAAFAEADHVVSAVYHPGRVSAAPMETRGVIASYNWSTDKLKVWSSTQMPHFLKLTMKLYLGFTESRTEIIVPDTGGGFGMKAHVFPEELLVPLLARQLGVPVKWVEDRRENLLAGSHAHEQFVSISYAVSNDGIISGVRTHALVDGGAYHSLPQTMAVEAWCTAVVTPTGVYDIPATEYIYEGAVTNKGAMGAYRGVGYMAGTLAREALIDDVARLLKLSPFEIRRKNVVKKFPWHNPQGIPFDEGSWLETIDLLEEMVDYPNFLERQAEARKQGRYLGLGLSVFVESSGESTGMTKTHGLDDTYYDTATVKMDPTGSVLVSIGISSQGQGHETSIAQIAADALGVTMEDVEVAGTSTDNAYGSGTVGSRGIVIAGGAVNRAAAEIREKLIELAAHRFGVDPSRVEISDGQVTVTGMPEAKSEVADIAMSAYFDDASWPDGFDPTLEATKAWDTSRPMFSNGGHAMIVEIDPVTGFVEVEKVFSVEDCGVMVNPTIVEGQLRGGVVQGIGLSLLERLVYDAAGNLTTTSFLDYQTPTMDTSPPFEIRHIETPSSISAAGIKGMGESGLIAAPAAVLNAVNDALAPFGSVLYDLPATPERVLDAINGVQSRDEVEDWASLWERAGQEPLGPGDITVA
ncbi:xanthine dehydrogenase family protein molybdopterin-binding subunit [Rhodococcoides fascians]|uniref:xanthine dehydrogenase family protein molybdopterin-binding subunit n=1 Tax=Rhodococcoides fascians TaxID=1828 RepID=UPI00050CB11B|nr:xanthine dehydrogenase family protein molybdopterin-binding subunit [Rhodococcus fascians]